MFLLAMVAMQLLTAPAEAGSAEEFDIKTILAAEYSYFEKIKSFDFTSRLENAHSPAFAERYGFEPGSYTQHDTRFRVLGEMYRTDLVVRDTPDSRAELTQAFNGEHVQNYDVDAKRLVVGAPGENFHPYLSLNPLLLPFGGFAIGPESNEPAFETMRDWSFWADLEKHSRIVGEKAIGGYRCSIVEFDFPEARMSGQEILYRSYFAVDLDFLPIVTEVVTRGGVVLHSYEAEDLSTVKDDKGNIFSYAAKASCYNHFDGGLKKPYLKTVIDAEGFQFNTEMDAAVFTLDKSAVEMFWDNDAHLGMDLNSDGMAATGPLGAVDALDLDRGSPVAEPTERGDFDANFAGPVVGIPSWLTRRKIIFIVALMAMGIGLLGVVGKKKWWCPSPPS